MHIDAVELQTALSFDLFEAGWDGTLSSYPGQPTRQFAMGHLMNSLVKKYLPGTSDKNPSGDAKALELFTKVNNSCRDWRLDTTCFSDLETVVLGEFRTEIDKFFYPEWDDSSSDGRITPSEVEEKYHDFILNEHDIVSNWGLGNGANIGASETDFYSKLATSSMCATDQTLHAYYVHAVAMSPTWTEMEHSRSIKRGYATVKGSRLAFVPKTTEISRTICTEPILNMLYQKGIAGCLEKRLSQVYGINLSTQPEINRELARIGSLTGKFGTIDLSSASDSISVSFCKEMLPKRVFDILNRFRCPSTTLPGGKEVELHMISSMGNAFTFPLQTILFSALVSSCYRAYGIKPVRSRGSSDRNLIDVFLRWDVEKPSYRKEMKIGNFAVFGDDIIVLEQAYKLVCKMLSIFGFSVNADKSFNEGFFRESCGSDFSSGHNVRGVYIKRLRDVNDCYSAINRLIRWSARHSIELKKSVSFLLSKVRFLPVPYDEQDDAGLKVPETMLKRRLLHPGTRATFYRYMRLQERRICISKYEKRCSLPGFFVNEAGLLVAFLAGSIRNGSVVLRTSRRRAVIRKRYSSRWDYITDARNESYGYAERWKSFACLLLSQQ